MSEFAAVFESLRRIMQPYASQLACIDNTDKKVYLNTKHAQKNKNPYFLARCKLRKIM